MTLYDRFGRFIFERVPAQDHRLYRFCIRYVDRFNGDNNSNPATNGEYRFVENELRNSGTSTVFDVGANVGDWASFAIRVNPRINLHCFEPSAITYGLLAGKQWTPNVRLNRFGFGESDGELELNIVSEGSGLNSLYQRFGVAAARGNAKEKVAITTVDGYCRRNAVDRLDLIKIDVEGHELAVMKGMTQMLSEQRVVAIQFEYGGCTLDAGITLRDVWQFLEPYGFRLYKVFPDGPRLIEKYHQELETFRYSNWVARHVARSH